MRNRLSLFLSHAALAAAAVLLWSQMTAMGVSVAITTTVIVVGILLLAGLAAFLFGSQTELDASLELIERAVVHGEKPTGTTPFDRCAERLQTHVQRWFSAAAEGRSLARDIDSVLALFEQDESTRKKYSNPAKQVRQWLSSLGRDSHITLRELIECNQEIDTIGKHVTSSAQQQNEIASRANREIESLSNDVTDLEQQATKARKIVEAAVSQSDQSTNKMGTIAENQSRIRTEIGNCEHKVRSLRDNTAEIETMLQSITEQSAKADMLALNASIESVRAGEVGRGFSVVAEEIRKLSTQINNASVSTLEKLSQVDSAVEEASTMLSTERDSLSVQETELETVQKLLSEIRDSADQFESHLQRLDGVSNTQSKRVDEVGTAIEGILTASDDVRNQVVEGGWKTRSLTELISRLTDALEPLLLTGTPEEQPIGDSSELEAPEETYAEENDAVCVG